MAANRIPAHVSKAGGSGRTGLFGTKTKRVMTDMDLQKFKSSLTARRIELERLLRNREPAAIETSADALDQIQHAVEREMALGNLARESACLRDARAALRRIDEGIFGTCVECEEDISLKRLAAAPWAARCIVCQERGDRDGATADNAIESELIETA